MEKEGRGEREGGTGISKIHLIAKLRLIRFSKFFFSFLAVAESRERREVKRGVQRGRGGGEDGNTRGKREPE